MTLLNVTLAGRAFTAGAAFEGIKNVCLWCGHIVKVAAVDYLFPAMRFIWPYISAVACFAGRMLLTAPGLGTMGLLVGISASAACFAYSKSGDLKGPGYRVHRWTLQIAAIAFAALGGASFATGIALGIG